MVDRAVGTMEIPKDSIVPVARDHTFNDCLEGDASVGTQTAHILSVEKLLLKEERSRIADLQAMEQERLLRLREPSP